ncbi:MAG: hypothetical protein DRP09_16805, partial [Candidatus Thorarchaeota archaeon]
TLFSALEALLEYRNLKRYETYNPPGKAMTEERGATFGKVTGIEEVIAAHAANVALLRNLEETLFNSHIEDDRGERSSEKVELGSIAVVRSDEYGEEVYGIDTAVEDAFKLSFSSPLAKALLGHQRGESVAIRDIEYRIVDVKSARDKHGIIARAENMAEKTIEEAQEALEVVEESGFAVKELRLRRKLRISKLLDKINLLEIIAEIYGVEISNRSRLLKTKVAISGEEHFPVDGLEMSLRHIMERVKNS